MSCKVIVNSRPIKTPEQAINFLMELVRTGEFIVAEINRLQVIKKDGVNHQFADLWKLSFNPINRFLRGVQHVSKNKFQSQNTDTQ